MHVLGTVNASPQPGTSQPHRLAAVTDPASRFPQIWSLAESSVTVQIIMYDRPLPSRMQYMSLSPISLALGDKHMAGSVATPFSHTKSPLPIDPRRQYLLSKLQQHTVVRHAPGEKELMLAVILSQINCSFEMMQLLSRNAFLLGARQKRSVSLSDRVVESATTLWQMALYLLWRVWTVWIYPYLTQGFIYGLICHRIVAELVLRVLEWQPPRCRMALKDVSATAQQFDIRLQQFCYWPIQYSTLRKRRTDWESVTDKHPDYIRFYNSLWLVANDIIIGIALGSYIIENAYWVAYQINTVLSIWTIAGLRSMIFWLMDWPAGLKLNTELAHFLGHLSRWIIHYWAGKSSLAESFCGRLIISECVDHLKPFLPHVIYLIGFSAFAGATMPISLFSDLLSLLTIHIYCFYAASARIFHWQLSIIVSLFHLFRGKKHNVLRNRIDSCDYDLDQLLLGTILFTLLFFLLPTVAVFYLTFTAARIIIISLKAVLDIALACLNHFPLFALMLRVKDPRRLPGGISFELQQSPTLPSPFHVKGKSPAPTPSSTTANGSPLSPSSSLPVVPPAPPPTSLILLRSVPLSLRAILDQYFQLAARLREHYISPRVFMDLATGGFLPPIERRNLYSLQYSMLPARRPGVGEVWKALWDDDGSGGGESGGGGGDVGRWGDNGKGERGEVGHEWARNGDLAKR